MFDIESALKYIGVDPFDFELKEEMFCEGMMGSLFGASHTYRVMILCAEIAKRLERPYDGKLAFIAAFFHDMGRKSSARWYPNHGRYAASIFINNSKLYRKYRLSADDKANIRYAIVQHSLSEWVSPKSSKYNVWAILKDANSLDRVRFDDFEARYLHYDVSHELIDDSGALFRTFEENNIASVFTGSLKETLADIDFSSIDISRDSSLRDYQMACKERIFSAWQTCNNVLLQMPTGTGKTRLFVSIVKDLHDFSSKGKNDVNILLLAHRKELIEQINEHLEDKYGLSHGYITTFSRENRKYNIQVGSVPTLNYRLSKWSDNVFDVVIIDEAHHVKAETYKKILKTFSGAKVLGVTATPCRLSGEGFRPEFDTLITTPSISWFIKKQYLCDYDYYSIRFDSEMQSQINNLDLAFDGDYKDESMLEVMDNARVHAQIVDSYRKIAAGKKGIVYTIDTSHNNHICDKYNAAGYRAVAIDSTTPKIVREMYVKEFKAGKIDILCNVNIFSEGFDCPDVEFIQLARPTKSLSLYLQQVGRGLRPAKGKDKVIIIDNVGSYNRFGFPTANRHWEKHFNGFPNRNELERFLIDSKNDDEDKKRELHIIEEGHEDVELLHSSAFEKVDEQTNMLPMDYSEAFVNYCQIKGFPNATDEPEILKNHVDPFIRKHIDANFDSLTKTIDADKIQLYQMYLNACFDYMGANIHANNQYSIALNHYLDFARAFPQPKIEVQFVAPEETVLSMLEENMDNKNNINELEDLERTIRTLKGLGVSIPPAVLRRYQKLLQAAEQERLCREAEDELVTVIRKYQEQGLSIRYNEGTGLVVSFEGGTGLSTSPFRNVSASQTVASKPNIKVPNNSAENKEKNYQRRPQFKFSSLGINVGEELEFTPTGVTVKVVSDGEISFYGHKYTLTRFILTFMPKDMRIASKSYNVTKYYKYKGKTLEEIKKERTAL